MKRETTSAPLSAHWTGGTKQEFFKEVQKLGLDYVVYVMSDNSVSLWACAKENLFVVISTFSEAHRFVRIQPVEIAKQFGYNDFAKNN
jgi:hypothetical protein